MGQQVQNKTTWEVIRHSRLVQLAILGALVLFLAGTTGVLGFVLGSMSNASGEKVLVYPLSAGR